MELDSFYASVSSKNLETRFVNFSIIFNKNANDNDNKLG